MPNLQLLNELRGTPFKAADLEELMFLDTFAHALRTRYEARNTAEPDWLALRITELGVEIRMRTSDAIQKRIRELKAQQQTLLTPAEKKAAIKNELAELEAALTQ